MKSDMIASPTSPDDATASGSTGAAQRAPAAAIDSRESCRLALLDTLHEAARCAARSIVIADADFTAWPLGRADVVEALAGWVRSHHRLILLGADFMPLATGAPRWMAWRRQWSHVVQCLAVHEELAADVPSVLLVPGLLAVALHDRERGRGTLTRSRVELARWSDAVDALSQRADECLPVTTLGL